MKNLITGINGFAASHLADLLLSRNEKVCGVTRSPEKIKNISHLEGRIEVFPCDIQDRAGLKTVLEKIRPDRIYHLASITFVPEVEKGGTAAFESNFFGTLNLMESIKELRGDARVLYVGSSEEYGWFEGDAGPINEETPLVPVSLYGVSKAGAELLAHSYVKRDGMDVIRVRPFNHVGPRQDSRFACSSFARQIAEIEKGATPVIRTGNLDSFRDFMDVRDTVRAYHSAMEAGHAGDVFNVCSGKAVSVRFALETLLSFSEKQIKIETDPELFREAKSGAFWGDGSRLIKRTGWHPEIPLGRTLEDILNYWRQNI